MTLYDAGWRQGTVTAVGLDAVLLLRAGPTFDSVGKWIVATQNCDLTGAHVDDDGPRFAVELRPIRTTDPPRDLGIRSRLFLLERGQPDHLRAEDPRLHLSPCRLAECPISRMLPTERIVALRTWLGLRYDRPAVPPERVELMNAVARLIQARRGGGEHVHDVLVQAAVGERSSVHLIAVVEEGPHAAAWTAEARRWLGNVAAALDPELGAVDRIEAGTKAEISLALVESSWSADVTQITWGKGSPRGAA